MVDLVITPANVISGANASIDTGIAGIAVTAGQALYYDSTVKKYLLADADSATVAARKASHIALNSAGLNQTVSAQRAGEITLGATLVAGTDYWLSGTAGGICPRADIGAGEWVGLVGIAKSTTVLVIAFVYPGVSL